MYVQFTSCVYGAYELYLPKSSIVNEVIRAISNLFFFFLQKDFERKRKHQQAKINQQNKIKQTLNSKGNIFYARKNF